MALPFKVRLPSPALPWINPDGRPTLEFGQYMQLLDQLARALASGQAGTLVNAANDAAAAAAGVPVGGLYRSASQVMVRVV